MAEPLSPRNSEVARLRALARDRRARHEAGRFIEVQGTAEGHAFTDAEFAAMIGLARVGIEAILTAQIEAIASAGK